MTDSERPQERVLAELIVRWRNYHHPTLHECADELEAVLRLERIRKIADESARIGQEETDLVWLYHLYARSAIKLRVPAPEAPQSKRETCRHQYWDLGYCIDCGIHSNDPLYAEQLRKRAAAPLPVEAKE